MKKLSIFKYITVALICTLTLFVVNNETKATDANIINDNAPQLSSVYDDICPAYNLTTTCGTRRTFHCCGSIASVISMAEFYNFLDCMFY